MKKFKYFLFLAAMVLALPFMAGEAAAQATRTWVSGVGDDVNPCSRTAPCKTFAGAISKTAAGGEINALDPGGFGAVTITKSMTISGTGTHAGILVSGTNGIIINAAATDVVTISGIEFEGIRMSAGSPGLSGIKVLSAGRVQVESCRFRDFSVAGVEVVPTTNPVKVEIARSHFANNNSAVLVTAPTVVSTVAVSDVTMAGNPHAGIEVSGAQGTAILSGSVLTGSHFAVHPLSSGKILTLGNNTLANNDGSETFTGSIALK